MEYEGNSMKHALDGSFGRLMVRAQWWIIMTSTLRLHPTCHQVVASEWAHFTQIDMLYLYNTLIY